jgi:hypothetical protein
MAVDAARAQCDVAARRLADSLIAFQDKGGLALSSTVEQSSKEYRATQKAYSDALEQLANSLRGWGNE